jgi:hypothetical protein
MPSEHGGWSLTLEPALLGLLVEPSLAGVLLAIAGILSFVIRTPLKLVVGDRLRRRRLPRTRSAERVMTVELIILSGVVAGAVALAGAEFWMPILLAAPLIAVGLAYDVRARSRRLVAELAGTVGVAAIGSAIVLAGGGSIGVAWGVWLVAAARAIAAVPYVRVQLRRAKGQAFTLASSDLAGIIAGVVVLTGWYLDAIPLLAWVPIAGMAAFHTIVLRLRPAPRAPILGAQQVVWGLIVVLVAGLAFAAP